MAQSDSARKPGDPFAMLHGKAIAIENIQGPFRACSNCEHKRAVISTEPVGMHHGRLQCVRCGNTTAWLSRTHLEALLAAEIAEQTTDDLGSDGAAA